MPRCILYVFVCVCCSGLCCVGCLVWVVVFGVRAALDSVVSFYSSCVVVRCVVLFCVCLMLV